MTVFDASVLVDALVVADRRLAEAPGPRCPVMDVAQFAASSLRYPVQRSGDSG